MYFQKMELLEKLKFKLDKNFTISTYLNESSKKVISI